MYGRQLLALRRESVNMVRMSDESTFEGEQTSILYYSDGSVITEVRGARDAYYLTIDEIPTEAVEAMISIEDKKFYAHRGIDYKAVARAIKAYIEENGQITQGGSTITQQLARNIFLTNEKTLERKLREAFIALELERKYSKLKIMEFYLNNIYFANGYYGLGAAAKGYFAKDVSELSMSEIAFLCAIPNNPTNYEPYGNYDNTLARRDRILKQMKADGKLNEEELDAALNEKIELVRVKRSHNDYVETYAYRCAIEALMKNTGFVFRYWFTDDEDYAAYAEEYNAAYCEQQMKLFTAGYRIYTSIDSKKQKQLQKSINDALAYNKETSDEDIYKLQGAAVTIENATGRVIAIVGGRQQKHVGYSLNRAFQSFRQPGSAIKPLIVYTPAFERGYSPEDTVEDVKRADGPSNVDFWYQGQTTIENAVTVSKNTVAWDLFNEITPKEGLSYLVAMKFSNITQGDLYPAASLGGLYKGVSPLEMTSAYETIENGGIYRDPTCIIRITDADGNVVADENLSTKRIYDEDAAVKMTHCLQKVMERGTGKSGRLENISCAGKTGTTTADKDQWFVGFTRYYTTGVWVGYDMPESLDGMNEEAQPLQIWKSYMEKLHSGLENAEFPEYVPVNAAEEELIKEKSEEEAEETTEDESAPEEFDEELSEKLLEEERRFEEEILKEEEKDDIYFEELFEEEPVELPEEEPEDSEDEIDRELNGVFIDSEEE